MMDVFLLVKLFARQADFRGVDDDHVIAGVDMRGVYRLMLSPEDGCYLGRKTAEDHVLCVHNVPVALNGFAFCHIGFHGDSSNKISNLACS
ncbi:hypothetical protein SDC9_64807 [bioreactor metagenome]|uniref:Uncharacterized protein n=1 Tax=bioreactor metagenome TaxID=1076179 RepID=A0A644XRK4_9ZZZZ